MKPLIGVLATSCVLLALPVLCAQNVVAPQSTLTGENATSDLPNADAKAVAAFQAECLRKARVAAKTYDITVRGKNGWLFFGPELRHVGMGQFWGEAATKTSQANVPEEADPLPAIVDFKQQLDKAGIELIMVPVPPKAVIYPDMVSSGVTISPATPRRFDVQHQQFYELLRGQGITVLDLTPEFLAHRLDESSPYCKQDTHWSGRGGVLAARQIAAMLQSREWLAATPKQKLVQQWKRVTIEGDLWQGLGGKPPARETLPLRFVGTRIASTAKNANPTPKPIAPNRASPVLLLGDSHTLVFHEGENMHTKGAGLPDQLAAELGFAVDLIGVRGSGATPSRTSLLRRARANPNYLKQKKVVIWCFSAREWTESLGWQKVPIVP